MWPDVQNIPSMFFKSLIYQRYQRDDRRYNFVKKPQKLQQPFVCTSIKNNSNKMVKKISAHVLQCIDVAMFAGGHCKGRVISGSNFNFSILLEPPCFKKLPKKDCVKQSRYWLGEWGPLKALNNMKLILNNQGGHSFSTILVSFRTFRHPLLPKPVS